MSTETLIGILASIFTGLAMLPQLIKLLRNKCAGDLSLLTLVVLMTGLLFWICYGFLKNDLILLISNAFSLIVNVLLTFFSIKYKHKRKTVG